MDALEAQVTVRGDTAPLQGSAVYARSLAAQIDALRPEVTVGVQDNATTKIGQIQTIASALGLIDPEVTVTAQTVTADAKLRYIETTLNRLDGRHVQATANMDADGARLTAQGFAGDLDRAGDKAGTLTERLRSVDSMARVFATGGIIGAVGALGPLGAAALVAGSALTGVAAGFGLVGLAAVGAFNDIEFKEGQWQAKKDAILSRSQQDLVASLNAFAGVYAAAMAPAEAAVASLAGNVLAFLTPALAGVGTAATLSVQAVEQAFNTLQGVFTVPAQLQIFRTFLDALPGLTNSAALAAGYLGTALFNMVAVPVNSGMAGRMLSYVTGLLSRFTAWTQSAEGQNAIAMFFEQAVPVAGALATAVGQIATGFYQLVQSGVAAELAINIATLLGTVGENLPVLIPFIYAINQMLTAFNALPAPLQSFIIQMVAINSVLGLLGLSPLGLFSTAIFLLGARLAVFATTGVWIPGIFSMIGTAISTLWTTAGTALSGLIGLISQFGSTVAGFFVSRLPASILLGVGAVGAALATLVFSWQYILGPAGIIVGVLIGFAAFVAGGWVLLVVAAVVSAAIAIGVAIYRNWETIKAAAGSIVTWFQGLPGWLQNTFMAALAVSNPLEGLYSVVANLVSWLQGGGGQGIINWFGSLPGWVQSAFSVALAGYNPLQALYSIVTGLVSWLQGGGGQGILDWFGSLPGWLYNALATALSSNPIFGPIFDSVTGLVDWFTSGNVTDSVTGWFESLPSWLLSGLVTGIRANPLFGPIFDAVKALFDWAGGSSMLDSWVSMGANWVLGIIRGIASKARDLINYLWDLAQNAYNSAVEAVSGSPPFYSFGLGITEGTMAGIRAGAPDVIRAARDMADSALASAQGLGNVDVAGVGPIPRKIPTPTRTISPESYSKQRRRRGRTQPVVVQIDLGGNRVITQTVEAIVSDNYRSGIRGSALGW